MRNPALVAPDPEYGPLSHHCPWWCTLDGAVMEVVQISKGHRVLLLEGDGTRLFIKSAGVNLWLTDWRTTQGSGHPGEWAQGRRYLSSEEVAAAFGLSDSRGKNGDSMLAQYVADSAEPGKYVRRGRFLNIPNAGGGYIGDPNLSVYVTDEIRNAVRTLLG